MFSPSPRCESGRLCSVFSFQDPMDLGRRTAPRSFPLPHIASLFSPIRLFLGAGLSEWFSPEAGFKPGAGNGGSSGFSLLFSSSFFSPALPLRSSLVLVRRLRPHHLSNPRFQTPLHLDPARNQSWAERNAGSAVIFFFLSLLLSYLQRCVYVPDSLTLLLTFDR